MASRTVPEPRSTCAVAASLDIIGDRWTLLVLRDMLLRGHTRFADLAADESIATNVLTDRLQRLLDTETIARTRDPEDARRWIYVPRQPAIDLIPIVVALMDWGDKYTDGQAPEAVVQPGPGKEAFLNEATAAATARMLD